MKNDRCLWEAEWVIPSELAEGSRVLEEILEQLANHEWGTHDIYSVRLALDEAIVNAIKHGNRHDESKQVRIACKLRPRELWVEIADEGPGFDPTAVPDCTCEENLEVPSGRGLMLMRCFMSRVEYNQRGNSVVMEKQRAEKAPDDAKPSQP
ncbi:MAG: ATP-binding protein [Planctomycetaceae bacterium]|nr:ATP-binding protein [Planctomycetaceae bacterium]